MDLKAAQIIEKFNLEPHPEGGFYKRVFESKSKIRQEYLPPAFTGDRAFLTSIYYVISKGQFSAFHKLKQDEIWHLYSGGPVLVHKIDAKGVLDTVVLGHDYVAGQVPHVEFRPGTVFAAELTPHTDFAFLGCSVSPGFEFSDMQLCPTADLLSKYPSHKDLIVRLSHHQF
jgi:predicted cupin superfamily sugar epimerase